MSKEFQAYEVRPAAIRGMFIGAYLTNTPSVSSLYRKVFLQKVGFCSQHLSSPQGDRRIFGAAEMTNAA